MASRLASGTVERLLDGGVDLIRSFQELGEGLVPLMRFLTFLGEEEFYVLVFPLLYWSLDRALGLRMGIVLLVSNGLNAVLKLTFRGPRPYWHAPGIRALAVEPSFGIPSGHAQNAVAVWGLLAAALRRWWAWVAAVILIVGIGVSRVHLGVHFPSDALGGWLVGGALLWGFLRLEPAVRIWLSRRSVTARILAVLAASLSLILAGALARLALVGWELPAAWAQQAAAAGPEAAPEPVRLSGVVTSAGALFGLGAGVVLLRVRGGFETRGRLWRRVVRYPVGMAGVAVFWYGLGAVLPGGETAPELLLRFLRYTLVGGWIGAGAPWLFVRLGLAPGGSVTTAPTPPGPGAPPGG